MPHFYPAVDHDHDTSSSLTHSQIEGCLQAVDVAFDGIKNGASQTCHSPNDGWTLDG